MEGVGSRLGRSSSRYGPATTVFSGPVRKWKKQWVQVSSSSSSTISHKNNHHHNNASSLMLWRWTPISPANTEEPPRRKFRYSPIVVLEEQTKEIGDTIDEQDKISRVDSLTMKNTSNSDNAYGKPASGTASGEEMQATNKSSTLTGQQSNISHLNLDFGFKGQNDNHESDGENKESNKFGRASSSEFRA